MNAPFVSLVTLVRYLAGWTRWNHARAAAPFAAAVAFTLALWTEHALASSRGP